MWVLDFSSLQYQLPYLSLQARLFIFGTNPRQFISHLIPFSCSIIHERPVQSFRKLKRLTVNYSRRSSGFFASREWFSCSQSFVCLHFLYYFLIWISDLVQNFKLFASKISQVQALLVRYHGGEPKAGDAACKNFIDLQWCSKLHYIGKFLSLVVLINLGLLWIYLQLWCLTT